MEYKHPLPCGVRCDITLPADNLSNSEVRRHYTSGSRLEGSYLGLPGQRHLRP